MTPSRTRLGQFIALGQRLRSGYGGKRRFSNAFFCTAVRDRRTRYAYRQPGSMPCALMTGIAVVPVRNVIKARAASGAFELALTAPSNAVYT